MEFLLGIVGIATLRCEVYEYAAYLLVKMMILLNVIFILLNGVNHLIFDFGVELNDYIDSIRILVEFKEWRIMKIQLQHK